MKASLSTGETMTTRHRPYSMRRRSRERAGLEMGLRVAVIDRISANGTRQRNGPLRTYRCDWSIRYSVARSSHTGSTAPTINTGEIASAACGELSTATATNEARDTTAEKIRIAPSHQSTFERYVTNTRPNNPKNQRLAPGIARDAAGPH